MTTRLVLTIDDVPRSVKDHVVKVFNMMNVGTVQKLTHECDEVVLVLEGGARLDPFARTVDSRGEEIRFDHHDMPYEWFQALLNPRRALGVDGMLRVYGFEGSRCVRVRVFEGGVSMDLARGGCGGHPVPWEEMTPNEMEAFAHVSRWLGMWKADTGVLPSDAEEWTLERARGR